MSTNNFYKYDLNNIYNIVQSSMLKYPKEMIIGILKDFFSKDDYYHFSKDQWGFSNTTDHTDLIPGSDLPPRAIGSTAESENYLSTRLYIGENYRYSGIFYPAVLVKSGGGRSVQISFNRDSGSIRYEDIIYQDGYGNETVVKRPVSFVTVGAWEGSFNIDVITRSLVARDDLMEAISMCFTEIHFDTLCDVGLIIKPLQYGAPSETEDRNDKLFRQSITLDIRTEWRREIPIGNLIDTIFFTATIEELSNPNNPVPVNLNINSEISISDILNA